MLQRPVDAVSELHILVNRDMSGALLDLAPDGILAVSESGRIETANAMAARLLGYERVDFVGLNLIDLLRPSVRGDGVAWLRDVQGRGDFADVCVLRADATLAQLQLAVRAIKFEGEVVFACYLRETGCDRPGVSNATLSTRPQCLEVSEWYGERRTDSDPTVYIVISNSSLRSSLVELLERCGWKVQAFDAASGFLARKRDGIAHCAVLDVELPDLDNRALQSCMEEAHASLPIILIASNPDGATIARCMRAGAFGLFTTPLAENEFLASIHDAIAKSTSALAQAAVARALGARYMSLTPRERDVMRGVVSGLLNKQVAAELGISEITVKAHRGRVMRKMQSHSLAELVNFATALGVAAHGMPVPL